MKIWGAGKVFTGFAHIMTHHLNTPRWLADIFALSEFLSLIGWNGGFLFFHSHCTAFMNISSHLHHLRQLWSPIYNHLVFVYSQVLGQCINCLCGTYGSSWFPYYLRDAEKGFNLNSCWEKRRLKSYKMSWTPVLIFKHTDSKSMKPEI